MNLETFFEKFEQFAGMPDAVGRMRQLVLSWAVQGRLVAKNPTDEPAERSFPRLASAAVKADEDCFPQQWLCVPLGKCGKWLGGGTPSKSRADFWEGNIPWVSPKDMKVLHVADSKKHISAAAVEGSSVRLIPTGSLLMVVRGMILIRTFPVALTTAEVTINQDMKALLPAEPDFRGFLLIALRAFEPDILAAVERSSHGTCKLKTDVLHGFKIPVPPLAEQKRIVAKVDELMALCDRLEAQQQERETRHAALARASLARFAEAPTPSNLGFLFHKSYDISPADLRKSILTLAVQGKLVPQDPAEEPASESLAQKAPPQAKSTPNDRDNINTPFVIPSTWRWATLGELVESMSNGIYKPARYNCETGTTCVRMFNIQNGHLDLSQKKRLDLKPAEVNRYRLETGDLLVNRVNSLELVGKSAVVEAIEETLVFEAMNIRVRLRKRVNLPNYVNLVLRTERVRAFFRHSAKQAIGQASINQKQLASVSIPVPPLTEQHRIVARVDQLMSLVDKLDAQLSKSHSTAAHLMGAVVGEFSANSHDT